MVQSIGGHGEVPMISTVFAHVLWSTENFLSQKLSAYPFLKALLCVLKLNVGLMRHFRN